MQRGKVVRRVLALQKFSELIFLYNGKKMHAQALDLLQQWVL